MVLSNELSIGVLAAHDQPVPGNGREGNGSGPFNGKVTAVGATAARSTARR
jgi:hypothetical protein